MDPAQRILLPDTPIESLDAYVAGGGGRALARALATLREEVIAQIKASGLRGRGGAGFPAGVKWETVAQDPCPTKYLVCNGAEGEPGTFKDRMLLRRNPYQLLEGMAIASFAINAARAFLCIKKSFEKETAAVSRAVGEMTGRGFFGPAPVELVLGPEDYLFGEEKGLLEVIEGGDPMPREADRPPYVEGLFVTDPTRRNPAVVNNVETLSNVPHIVLRGPEWFRSLGTADTPGTMVFTVSGDVQRPGVYELPMGTPLRDLISGDAGGLRPGRALKAVCSGVSCAVILPSMLDTPMDFGSLQGAGAGLGSGGFVVYDDTACMVRVAHKLSEFLYVESCGQCTSCKFGTNMATYHLHRLIHGGGTAGDVEYALEGAAMAPHANRCYLPVEHSLLIPSIVRSFRAEFEAHYGRGCQSCRAAVLPKILDFDEVRGDFVYARAKKPVAYAG
ncbi:MAG TPA: NADH-ubiquinone oxidoreductase-F iron-sulfur binding region domain-containing protein [Candidatus Methylomirabilis sp.]|jgi:NADH:ubiquinone oxidoreductase subunit F (NADH-binding)